MFSTYRMGFHIYNRSISPESGSNDLFLLKGSPYIFQWWTTKLTGRRITVVKVLQYKVKNNMSQNFWKPLFYHYLKQKYLSIYLSVNSRCVFTAKKHLRKLIYAVFNIKYVSFTYNTLEWLLRTLLWMKINKGRTKSNNAQRERKVTPLA